MLKQMKYVAATEDVTNVSGSLIQGLSQYGRADDSDLCEREWH